MEVDSVFVTGANRGIGLEFVRQLVKLPRPPRIVFATYRNRDTAKALKEIRDATKTSQVLLIKMDVSQTHEIAAAAKIVEDMVGDRGLTLLINNAGAAKSEGFPDITAENMLFHFTTNTVGPLSVLKALYPLLLKSATHTQSGMNVQRAAVINISSAAGSMTALSDDAQYKEYLQYLGYRASKSALNMEMRVVALDMKNQGVLVVQMCPGWVKTDMGGEVAEIEVHDSVGCMLSTLPILNESHQGAFLDRHGNNIPF